MDTPVRKYQKQKDYQRHKLFRKMKRRRRAAIEQAKDAPMKQLRRKLKIPKFEDGKDNKPNVFQLADGTSQPSQQMDRPNIFRYDDGRYVYQASPNAEEIEVSPINTLLPNPSQWTYQDASGKIYTPHTAQVDTGSIIQDEERNPLVRAANNYFKEAAYRAKDGTLALQGKYTMPAIAASALLPVAGEAAYPILTNPYVDAGIASAFAGHGLNHAINEGIDGWGDAAMTALELAPLGKLAKPVYKGVVQPGMKLFNSPITGNWTKIGNREYRFKPGHLGMNGAPVESREATVIVQELPIGENRYYRAFDKYALDSYRDLGVISQFNKNGFSNSRFDVPHFSKGAPLETRLQDPTSIWAVSKPNASLVWESKRGSGASYYYTPTVNGEYNAAPISEFDFYRALPNGKGYVKLTSNLNVPEGINLSSTPHIDYLNSLNEQQQIEYLTDNGLNSQWLWTLKNRPDYLESALSKAHIPDAARTPQITAENAASMTPEQWTAAQDAAIAKGDMAEAQRLRDLHFKVSAPDTKIITESGMPLKTYHTSHNRFNSFKQSLDNEYDGFGVGNYFSKEIVNRGPIKYETYLNSSNPYIAKYKQELPTTDGKSVRFDNIDNDYLVRNHSGVFGLEGNEITIYDPKNIKLANAITYADDGTRIPLGSRDNFNINDIRYDKSFDELLQSTGLSAKRNEIISYLENAEPVPRDILKRPLSSLDEDGKVQRSVANGINDAIKFLRSGGYKTRLKNLGYTGDEANYIINSQIDNIRKADVVTLPKYNKMYSRHGMATPYRREDGTMGYQIALQPEKSLAYNPRVTAAHEAFHVGSNRHDIKDFTSIPQDIREHNASIRPIVNDDYDAKLVFEGLDDEELRARALEVLARSERANMPVMDYINKWGADPIPGKGPGILRNPNYDHNANDLRTYFTPESLKRYLEGVAGIAAPLAGGTALLGYNSLGQPTDTYKHGKDSGIHINPKNRGKFNALKKRTGKTTEQLTHSKNPLTRKRAIFAQNAKKFKH